MLFDGAGERMLSGRSEIEGAGRANADGSDGRPGAIPRRAGRTEFSPPPAHLPDTCPPPGRTQRSSVSIMARTAYL